MATTRKYAQFRKYYIGGIGLAILGVFYFFIPTFFPDQYDSARNLTAQVAGTSMATSAKPVEPPKPVVSHVTPPESTKAIYVTSYAAGNADFRKKFFEILDTTEVNAIVIDIKDYTGKVSFIPKDAELKEFGSGENRIPDIDEYIQELHKRNVYVIGRLSAFQDPYVVSKKPELAVKRESDGGVWKDHKGITWVDAGATENWDYLIKLAKESYSRGFDEVNYDYIRFPSDGNMKDIAFPFSKDTPKAEVIRQFFEYVGTNLKGVGIKTSADLFGMAATNRDDLGIGQLLENALPYFDYVDPMVYPSHYPATWGGFSNPNAHPYEVVKISMDVAVKRAIAASSSPLKIRPWLQSFSLGQPRYTAADVRAQIQATYDAGLTSWLLWDASNKYVLGGLESE